MNFQVGDWVERRNPGAGARHGTISGLLREGYDLYFVTGGVGMTYVNASREFRPAAAPIPLPEWAG